MCEKKNVLKNLRNLALLYLEDKNISYSRIWRMQYVYES